jgi:hypothetical protein
MLSDAFLINQRQRNLCLQGGAWVCVGLVEGASKCISPAAADVTQASKGALIVS